MTVVPFKFGDRPLRVITHDDGSWCVVAKDVVEGIGAKWNGRTSIAHVPNEWKLVSSVDTSFGIKETQFLTEQGLYFYLGRSDKPNALPYQKWIAGEVVPTIRRTGEYRQTYEGAAVLQRIDRLTHQLDLLNGTCLDTNRCVHGFADNQRTDFDKSTQRDVAGCTLRFFGGKCPNCSDITVVDSGGNPLSSGQLDHWNGRQNKDRKNCWLICVDCHQKLRVQDYRNKRTPKFQGFQLDLERYCAPLMNPPPSEINLAPPPIQLDVAPDEVPTVETSYVKPDPEPSRLPAKYYTQEAIVTCPPAEPVPIRETRGRKPDAYHIRLVGGIDDLFGVTT